MYLSFCFARWMSYLTGLQAWILKTTSAHGNRWVRARFRKPLPRSVTILPPTTEQTSAMTLVPWQALTLWLTVDLALLKLECWPRSIQVAKIELLPYCHHQYLLIVTLCKYLLTFNIMWIQVIIFYMTYITVFFWFTRHSVVVDFPKN